MHRIIKMEEEDYPLHEHYDPALLNHCMTTFHDQDSNQEIIHAKCSTNDVHLHPIRLSPISHKQSISATLLSKISSTLYEAMKFSKVLMFRLSKKK